MAATIGTGGPATPSHPATEVNVFAVELRRWRDVRGHSRATLARAMGYDRSYVSKVESGTERPSEAFAAHAETALHAGGALRIVSATTSQPFRPRPARSGRTRAVRAGRAPVVDHDDAALRYDGGYRLTQRRRLVNGGTEPITRYLIRISVDRYPGDPERSNQLYSENPLAWEEIGLVLAPATANRANPHRLDRPPRPGHGVQGGVAVVSEHGHLPSGEACWIEQRVHRERDALGQLFQRRAVADPQPVGVP